MAAHFYANFVDVLTPSARLCARFHVTRSGPVTIGVIRLGTDVRIRFGELGAYHVDVPLSGSFRWRQGPGPAAPVSPGGAAVFQPAGDTTLDRWDGDCRILAVKIDRQYLENELAAMLDAPVAAPPVLGGTLDTTRGAGAGWLRLVRLIEADVAGGGDLTGHPLTGDRLRESLVSALLLGTEHQYRARLDNRRALLPAPRAVRRAAEAMRADPGRPFTAAELAELAGVSRRSLQEGFRRYLGVSPTTYLRHLRLGHAHDALRAGDPALETVAQIATRCGFTHLGRFAGAYRERYGVAPSVTLRG